MPLMRDRLFGVVGLTLRCLLALMSAISLLVIAATIWLWVHSESVGWDTAVYAHQGGSLWRVDAHGGVIDICIARPWPNYEPLRWFSGRTFHPNPDICGDSPGMRWNAFGMHGEYGRFFTHVKSDGTAWWNPTTPDAADVTSIYVWMINCLPLWMVGAVASIAPLSHTANWFRRRHKLARSLKGHLCISCGYDLQATPERCPECGTIPASPIIRRETGMKTQTGAHANTDQCGKQNAAYNRRT
jgi:hypothetical protein